MNENINISVVDSDLQKNIEKRKKKSKEEWDKKDWAVYFSMQEAKYTRQMIHQSQKPSLDKDFKQERLTTKKKVRKQEEYVDIFDSYLEACKRVSYNRQVMSGLTSNQRDVITIDIDKPYSEELANEVIKGIKSIIGFEPNIITINTEINVNKDLEDQHHFQLSYLLDRPFKGSGKKWVDDESGDRDKYITITHYLNKLYGDPGFVGGLIKNPAGDFNLDHITLHKDFCNRDEIVENIRPYINKEVYGEEAVNKIKNKEKQRLKKERISVKVNDKIYSSELEVRRKLRQSYGVLEGDILRVEKSIEDWSSRNCSAFSASEKLGFIIKAKDHVDKEFYRLAMILFEYISLRYNNKTCIETSEEMETSIQGAYEFVEANFDPNIAYKTIGRKYQEAEVERGIATRLARKYSITLAIQKMRKLGKTKQEIQGRFGFARNSTTYTDSFNLHPITIYKWLKNHINELIESYEVSGFMRKQKIIMQINEYIRYIEESNYILKLKANDFLKHVHKWMDKILSYYGTEEYHNRGESPFKEFLADSLFNSIHDEYLIYIIKDYLDKSISKGGFG